MTGKKEEATERCKTILALRVPDDELSLAAQAAKSRTSSSRPTSSVQPWQRPSLPQIQTRIQSMHTIRSAFGIDPRYSYGGARPVRWVPSDFGSARLAALAILHLHAQELETSDSFTENLRDAAEADDAGERARWDWCYLQAFLQDRQEMYLAARQLSELPRLDAKYIYLTMLPQRVERQQTTAASGGEPKDTTPPLPPDEIEHMIACYQQVRLQKPEWLRYGGGLQFVLGELERAKQQERADKLYQEAVASAERIETITSLLSVAAARGDVETTLGLMDKLDAKALARGSSATPVFWSGYRGYMIAQLMGKRAQEKAYDDALELFDQFMQGRKKAAAIRSRRRTPRSSRYTQSSSNYVQIYASAQPRHIQLEFPRPNEYYDNEAIMVLRNVYEIYKQADLLSDLFKHLGAKLQESDEAGVYEHLALCYLHWWEDRKSEASDAMREAVKAAPADVLLRLELAEILYQLGDSEEALAVIDAVEPLDQNVMRERELMAQSLAVQAGNIERARKGAERLFGLRLDNDTQLQLASQMHALGMHEMAEGVLARVRRRAGGQSQTLLTLMQQYQSQGKPDEAVQIAHTILRRSRPQTSTPGRPSSTDANRQQAMTVLARSGQLDTLIERVEKQLEYSPKSIRLHQLLADYYKAAGQPDKAKQKLVEIAALRPDDASFRYQLAQQMASAGDNATATEHYLAALRQDPALLARDYYRVIRAFRQAKRLPQLAKLLEEVDLRKLGRYHVASSICEYLLNEKEGRDAGLELFKRAWKAFPDERASLLGRMHRREIWELPEMYDYARQAVIPTERAVARTPWVGMERVTSYSSGKANGVATRLIEMAGKQNRLEELAKEVTERIEQQPDWLGGQAFMVVLDVKRGKHNAARQRLTALIDEHEKSIPLMVRWLVGQELESVAELNDVTLRLYESAKEEFLTNQYEFSYGPARRLVALYCQTGRKREARQVMLEVLRRQDYSRYGSSNPGYGEYRMLENQKSVAEELLKQGFPVDAFRLYSEALAAPEKIEAAKRWGGGDRLKTDLSKGLAKAQNAITAESLAAALRDWLAPTSVAPSQDAQSIVDLAIVVQPRALETATVSSFFQTALQTVAMKGDAAEVIREAAASLAELRTEGEADISVIIARIIIADVGGDRELCGDMLDQLACWMDEHPLDELDQSERPNARQRDQATLQLPIWLAARVALMEETTEAIGEKLAARALLAAQRQNDKIWALAMLRERGQLALGSGDRAAAEQHWSQMLELILEQPQKKSNRSTNVTAERMDQALQLARLAAGKDMHELSLRAVREVLAAGPPIQPVTIQRGRSPFPASSSSSQGSQYDELTQKIEDQVHSLHQIWLKKPVLPEIVYATLAAIVLPESRPAEVFLYPRPFNPQNEGSPSYSYGQPQENYAPRSVGKLLVNWAGRAKMTDDLRRRLQQRRQQPRAQLPAEILLTQLALAQGNTEEAESRLETLHKLLQQNSLQHSAELACHVAVPAVKQEATARVALPLVEQACRNFVASGLARRGQMEPTSTLLVMAARAGFELGDPETGNRLLRSYLDFHQENNNRYTGDSGLRRRKEQLQVVADALTRAGDLIGALKTLGEQADITLSRRSSDESGTFALRLAGQLRRLPAEERYPLLHDWCMPKEKRKSIRSIVAIAPDVRPPEVFGQLVGLQETPFQLPVYGATRDVFSTVAMLVETADQLGVLDALAADLRDLAKQKVENAQAAWIFAELALGNDAAVLPAVTQIAEAMQKSMPKMGDYSKPLVVENYLIASACIGRPKLRQQAQKMLRALVTHSKNVRSGTIRAVLRRALARAVVDCNDANAGLLDSITLKDWMPACHHSARTRYAGPLEPLWIAHEGHVQHISGGELGFLFYKYPLTGEFQFHVEALDDGWAEGDVSFAGLVYEFGAYSNTGSVYGVGRSGSISRPCTYRHRGEFNRLAIDVRKDSARLRANGTTIYEDTGPIASCPWFALFTTGERNPIFRNIQITGTPVIPREVRLTDDPTMRGWVANFYGDTRPTATEQAPDNPAAADLDWHVQDRVLHGRRRPGAAAQSAESYLYYQRPLFDREVISYEFFHEPGEFAAHPTLGRLAFLVREDGVRLHWLTRRDREWTGLDADNEVADPIYQRGPTPLPLKIKDWNELAVAIDGDTATLTLNGVDVYQRMLEKDNNRLFGFFHDRIHSELKVRNVVLRGDWPERVSTGVPSGRSRSRQTLVDTASNQTLASSATTVIDVPIVSLHEYNASDGHALNEILEERYVATDAYNVYRKSLNMPPEERYEYLAAWVLPGKDHSNFRLMADSTPTHPAPPVADAHPIDVVRSAALLNVSGAKRVAIGGNLVAPAIELVRTARELGRLDDLCERVEQDRAEDNPSTAGQPSSLLAVLGQALEKPTGPERPPIDRLSLLTMIHLARGDMTAANRKLQELGPHLDAMRGLSVYQRWGPTMAAGEAIEHPETRSAATQVLRHLVTVVLGKAREGPSLWQLRNRHLWGLARAMTRHGIDNTTYGTPPKLAHWRAVVHPRYAGRGPGTPRQHWSVSSAGAVLHTPGHAMDYMYYGIPLRGDFHVECELTSFGARDAQLAYAGFWAGLKYNRDKYQVSYFERYKPEGKVDPPIAPLGPWYRYRLTVKDNLLTTYVNDRKLHEQRVPDECDPWLAIRSFRANQSGFRNVRITGKPTVPESLNLSALPDLTGWVNTYYEETADDDDADWRKEGGTIVGRKKDELAGYQLQSLLYYHRPMLEDGSIEYEFLYRPGELVAHTALDRLVFLLEPKGVRIHWLTDHSRDRTGLLPDNAFDEPANRHGPSPLPLKTDDWNRIRLDLTGDTVVLSLNGQPICQRDLEPTNMRTFGLFHYADQTEVRVRNITYRGDWPRELPPVEEQQLAVDPVELIERHASGLKAVYRHDFKELGVPEHRFRSASPKSWLQSAANGLRMSRPGMKPRGGLHYLHVGLRLRGDFDVTASFEDFKPAAPVGKEASDILMHVLLDTPAEDIAAVRRRHFADGRDLLHTSHDHLRPDGKRGYDGRTSPCKSQSGKLRLVRIGSVVYYLFAEADSNDFRLVDEWLVGAEDTVAEGIWLTVRTGSTQDPTEVVWKDLTVRADEIFAEE